MSSTICRRCKRELKNPRSIKIGYGPKCAALSGVGAKGEQQVDEYTDQYIQTPMKPHGIILERDAEGNVKTNIPHLVMQHSPDGFEWGYGGSGPADLALNIVEAVLFIEHYDGPRVNMSRGDCFRLASALHQDFKWKFIATVSQEVGRVILDYDTVAAWVNERRAAYSAL